MSVGKRIKQLRNENGFTQEELGQKIGVKKAAIQKYENGSVVNIKKDRLKILAEVLSTTPSYIMGWAEFDEQLDTRKIKQEVDQMSHGTRIPILGKVAAGIPIEAIENLNGDEWEEIPDEMATQADYFALRIQGNSMEPKFSEGDVVIVKKQDDIESGDIAVVMVNGDDATVKKVMKQDSGIVLVSLNSSVYPPVFYDNKSIYELPIIILGKVVELRAKF